MMYSLRMIGRVMLWNYRKNAGKTALVSLIVFLLLYGWVWQSGEISEVFTVYLGGFRQSVLLILFWLIIHLPAEGLLYGWVMDQFYRCYWVRLMKYEHKLRYLLSVFISVILQLITYYLLGYAMLTAFCTGADMGIIFWQMCLAFLESLSIVAAAAAISLLFPKCENIAFPAVIAVELMNCILCGRSEILRFLPFTYGKMVLQKRYFNNGVALAASLLSLGVLLALMTALWMRKDERSGEE